VTLLVATLGVALGAGGITLVHQFTPPAPTRLAATADQRGGQAAGRPLSGAAIRARVEPSVVDVTGTLTYDNETASGTGFVIQSGTVLILTNNHVIRDATSVSVTVPATGQTYPARIVGADLNADIAVLQVTPIPGLTVAPLGNSGAAGPGLAVVSFGNEAGAGGWPTVAAGVISGTGRTIEADDRASGFSETLHDMLATTAQIEPGDSGGPLADSAGVVIGVDTAAGTGGAATGYAIPIDAALSAERQIMAGHPGPGLSFGTGGFLGVILGSSTSSSPAVQQEQQRSAAGAAAKSSCLQTQANAIVPVTIARASAGALVDGVLCGTGAASAGIAAGDVITAADGHRIGSPDALNSIVNGCRPGTAVSVTWVSTSGVTRTSSVRLSSAPAA
jgi:S1-C subfamily serine protease